MRKQLLAVTALTLGFAGLAQAQETPITPSRSSEYYHAPAAGVNELTIHGGYALGTSRTEGAGAVDTDINGARNLGVEWVYGISDMFKVGADISYTTLTRDNGTTDTKNSGIEPIVLKGSGNAQLGAGTLVYGLRAQFAVDKAETEANGDQNRTLGDELSNFAEGGFELAPWVGYSLLLGQSHNLGAKVSYEVINTDTKVDSPAGEFTLSGGSEGRASVFYEYLLSDMPLGAALNYDWYTKIDNETTNTTAFLARSMIGVDLYTRINAGNWGILPTLSWREKASSDQFDKLSDVRLNIAGRFAF
ncbi:MAG: hypothetical protein EOP05_18420 [Proteobacteria bacterium]|nr:MAG: hypothetical protein EOP05_18420 [Pseudomonadota bacterium]